MIRQLKRWLKAREAEKNFWSQKDVKALKTSVEWENFVKENFGLALNSFSSKSILEVGCGPYGVIHFVDSCSSVGIDPIYFDTWNGIGKINASTTHIVATAEYLPFRDDAFDVCVCFNVLDHSIFPSDAMREIVRTLKPSGEVLLWVHAIRRALWIVAPLLSLIDKSHPHHFTFKDVLRLLNENDLIVASTLKKNIRKGNFLQQFVGFLRISLKLAVASITIFNVFIQARISKRGRL